MSEALDPSRAASLAIGPETRFRPPDCAARVIVREALLARMKRSTSRLLLVRGPPGAGKTVLLSQHYARTGMRTGWLSLDPADLDRGVLLRGLARAFINGGRVIKPDIVEHATALAQQQPELAARIIASSLQPQATPHSVIIDGCDGRLADAVAPFLTTWLRLVPSVQWLVGARARPRWSFVSLAAGGVASEVDPVDLQLDTREIVQLFQGRLSPRYASLLQQATEGHAIALQLAFCSASKAHDSSGSHHSNWRQQLSCHYQEESLSRLPYQTLEILARLAAVERFDLALGEAIGGPGAAATIESLWLAEGLLSRDRETGHFYVPAPLRTHLLQRHALRDLVDRRAVHRSAADWFAQAGLWTSALQHAVEAGELDRIASLLHVVGASMLMARLGCSAVQHLLAQLPTGLQSHPTVQMMRALLLAQTGQLGGARRSLPVLSLPSESQVLSTAVTGQPVEGRQKLTAALHRDYLVSSTFLSAYGDEPINRDQYAALSCAQADSDRLDTLDSGLAENLRCAIHLQAGRLTQAEVASSRALDALMTSQSPYAAFFVHLLRVRLRIWQNDLAGAEAEIQAATLIVTLFYPDDSRLASLVELVAALVSDEGGRAIDEDSFLQRTLPRLATSEGWPDAVTSAYTLGARVLRRRGESPLALLLQGREIARWRGLPRMEWHLACDEVEWRLESGDPAGAEKVLGSLATGQPARNPDTEASWYESFRATALSLRIRAIEDLRAATPLADSLGKRARGLAVPRASTVARLARALLHAEAGNLVDAASDVCAAFEVVGPAYPIGALRETGLLLHRAWPRIVPQLANPKLRDALHDCRLGAATPNRATRTQSAARGQLTERETQILALLSEGMATKRVAAQLGLREATVRFHLRNVHRKLEVRNRVQALARFREISAG